MSKVPVTMSEIQKAVGEILKGKYLFVVLLGSAATERFNADSDIDLAVYFKDVLTFSEMVTLSSKFSEYFDRECDLVALNNSDPVFAQQVLETGREVSIMDRPFYNLWKAEQLSKYSDFKRSRKIIEDNLLNRKKYV